MKFLASGPDPATTRARIIIQFPWSAAHPTDRPKACVTTTRSGPRWHMLRHIYHITRSRAHRTAVVNATRTHTNTHRHTHTPSRRSRSVPTITSEITARTPSGITRCAVRGRPVVQHRVFCPPAERGCPAHGITIVVMCARSCTWKRAGAEQNGPRKSKRTHTRRSKLLFSSVQTSRDRNVLQSGRTFYTLNHQNIVYASVCVCGTSSIRAVNTADRSRAESINAVRVVPFSSRLSRVQLRAHRDQCFPTAKMRDILTAYRLR